MKQFSINTLLALALCVLPETALAVSSVIQCSTVSGTRKTSHVPTTTKTVHSTVISSVTVMTTSTVTDTPAPTTITDTATTVSSTTTTLSQNTDTITSTEVDTATTTTDAPTSTSTAVSTSTVTTTTTATSTVATSAGFTPVSDTISGPSPAAARRDSVGFSRVKRALGSSKDPSALHPERVKCLKIVYTTKKRTTTVAGTTVTSTASTPTSVTTTTTTEVVTQTTQPSDASTTVTETSTVTNTVTSTPSTTVTSTATATETDSAPEATFYAQCDSDNLADSAGGDDINFIYGNGDYTFAHNVTTPYDCCVSCAINPDCAVSAYDASKGFCATADTADSTCTEGGEEFTAALGGPSGSGHTQTVSNGNCGYVAAS